MHDISHIQRDTGPLVLIQVSLRYYCLSVEILIFSLLFFMLVAAYFLKLLSSTLSPLNSTLKYLKLKAYYFLNGSFFGCNHTRFPLQLLNKSGLMGIQMIHNLHHILVLIFLFTFLSFVQTSSQFLSCHFQST